MINNREKEANQGVRALREALRAALGILSVVMISLAIMFLLSGIYWVEESTVAVHLRFGRVLGEPGSQIREPGGPYFALPEPVDRIIIVPTTLHDHSVDRAFWHGMPEDPEREEGEELVFSLRLEPGQDGFLITGDKNVVHGRWTVTYQVDYRGQESGSTGAPLDFARHVGSMDMADRMVGHIAEQAIVGVISQTSVNDFIKGAIDSEAITRRIQTILDRIKSGISVVAVSQREYTVPASVIEDFNAVNKAISQKALKIERAERERITTLTEVAGNGYRQLLNAIEAYRQAGRENDPAAIERAEAFLSELFFLGSTGGEAASIVSSARTARTETTEDVRGRAERFNRLVDLHRENPVILHNRLLQDTLQQIYSARYVETFYLPAGDNKVLYLTLNKGR